MNNLSLTLSGQSLFSNKGSAAPSPEAQTNQVRQFAYEAANEPIYQADIRPSSGLAGLIKRANPGHMQAVEPEQPHRFQSFTKPEVMRRPPQLKAKLVSSSRRRQMTVRIEMEKFEQLDRLAKSSGQTYQEIQANALDVYLFADNKMKRIDS